MQAAARTVSHTTLNDEHSPSVCLVTTHPVYLFLSCCSEHASLLTATLSQRNANSSVISELLLIDEHTSEHVSSLDVDCCNVHMAWQ